MDTTTMNLNDEELIAESRPTHLSVRWNTGNDDVEQVENQFDILLSHLSENEAEGPSVFSHRIKIDVPDAPMGGAVWDADVSQDEADNQWLLVLAFLFAMGRRYPAFVGTAYKVDGSDFGDEIEGVVLREQAASNFILASGDYVDGRVVSPEHPIVTVAVPIEHFPAAIREEVFGRQVDANWWATEGF